jgi:hypothetical protein
MVGKPYWNLGMDSHGSGTPEDCLDVPFCDSIVLG